MNAAPRRFDGTIFFVVFALVSTTGTKSAAMSTSAPVKDVRALIFVSLMTRPLYSYAPKRMHTIWRGGKQDIAYLSHAHTGCYLSMDAL